MGSLVSLANDLIYANTFFEDILPLSPTYENSLDVYRRTRTLITVQCRLRSAIICFEQQEPDRGSHRYNIAISFELKPSAQHCSKSIRATGTGGFARHAGATPTGGGSVARLGTRCRCLCGHAGMMRSFGRSCWVRR